MRVFRDVDCESDGAPFDLGSALNESAEVADKFRRNESISLVLYGDCLEELSRRF